MRFQPFRLGSRQRANRRSPGEKPKLAIVACLKNEADDLVEWLCFHRLIGVSRFVIYDNLSTDSTAAILDSVPFRNEIVVRQIDDDYPQKAAFADAIARYRDELDWVAFLDGDEFIVPLGDLSIIDKLAELEARGVDGFGIHWRIFGSSGHEERPRGLLTRSFIRRAKDGWKPNRHVKSIVRIAAIQWMVTQHYFRLKGPYLLDDGSEAPQGFEGVTSSKATFTQGFALHHYITKSRAQCFRKIARGRPRPNGSTTKFRSPSYWTTYDRNEVKDDRAAKIIEPIRDEVIALRKTRGRRPPGNARAGAVAAERPHGL